MRKVDDIVFWDTVTGVKSGKILAIRNGSFGTEYKVSRPDDRVVWINETSIIDK